MLVALKSIAWCPLQGFRGRHERKVYTIGEHNNYLSIVGGNWKGYVIANVPMAISFRD